MLLWAALGSLVALETVKRAARRRLKKRRTSFTSAFLHQGFVNQSHSGFNKHKTPDRFLPISLVPPQGRIAVALPPVPLQDKRFKSYNPAVFVHRGALYACVRGKHSVLPSNNPGWAATNVAPKFWCTAATLGCHPSLAGPERRQKNWAPFLHDDRLMFVYSVQPHIVLNCDEQSGLCEIAHSVHTDLPIQDLRGGTNLQLVNGAYVGFLHTTKPLQYDTYLYAFSASPPFQPVSFLDQQIFWARDWPIELPYVEFSTGFAILDRPEGEFWIISFGQNDSRPLIAIMSASQGLEMLAAGQKNLLTPDESVAPVSCRE
ncbi:g1218 [Coccomyxa elongata]